MEGQSRDETSIATKIQLGRFLLPAKERISSAWSSSTANPAILLWLNRQQTWACLLEPARDGVPGNPLDPSNRGNADTLDSESDDRVESNSSMLESVVGRALSRRERLSAPDAPVSTAFPGSRSVETVADDVPGTDSSVECTCGIETPAMLQFGLAFRFGRAVKSGIRWPAATVPGPAAAQPAPPHGPRR